MDPTIALGCPGGCKGRIKLVRRYGPHRTALYRCMKCGREFSSRYGSVFFGFHTEEDTIYRILKALSEGNGIRPCARIFGVHRDTVALILTVAARHCERVNEHLIQDYHLEECQLDELWSFVKKRKRTSQCLRNWQQCMETSGSGLGLTLDIR